MKEHYDRKTFFDAVREAPFGGALFQANVDGMNSILDAWEPTPFTDRRSLAYILGTVKRETPDMMPVEEIGKGRGRPYGLPHKVTGQTYYGRGQVQLTWHENYVRATEKINSRQLIKGRTVDLVNRPEQALALDVSPVILIYGMQEGWFTGKKLGDYFTATKSDWVNARRVVNGLDHAHEIAGYAKAFHSALTKAATAEEPEQDPVPEPDTHEADPMLVMLVEQLKERTGANEIILTIK